MYKKIKYLWDAAISKNETLNIQENMDDKSNSNSDDDLFDRSSEDDQGLNEIKDESFMIKYHQDRN